ncbi:hypothetical protein ABPG74_006640 [Tetrahymena malaccensis]
MSSKIIQGIILPYSLVLNELQEVKKSSANKTQINPIQNISQMYSLWQISSSIKILSIPKNVKNVIKQARLRLPPSQYSKTVIKMLQIFTRQQNSDNQKSNLQLITQNELLLLISPINNEFMVNKKSQARKISNPEKNHQQKISTLHGGLSIPPSQYSKTDIKTLQIFTRQQNSDNQKSNLQLVTQNELLFLISPINNQCMVNQKKLGKKDIIKS